MFAFLGRALLLRWLFGNRDRRRPARRRTYWGPPARSHPRQRYGYGRSRSRSRGGFGMFGPFPTYSRRTRGGSSVSVGGCCLPLPLALSAILAALARFGLHRR